MGIRILPDWVSELSLQKQAVLVLALRGPDGFPKYHKSKPILYYYRACLLAAAHKGRHLRDGEDVGSLMTLQGFLSGGWPTAIQHFTEVVDELPLHYFTHLMHGAQILAYHHPEKQFRDRWMDFYMLCCDYLHVPFESSHALDMRLSDFGRELDEVVD